MNLQTIGSRIITERKCRIRGKMWYCWAEYSYCRFWSQVLSQCAAKAKSTVYTRVFQKGCWVIQRRCICKVCTDNLHVYIMLHWNYTVHDIFIHSRKEVFFLQIILQSPTNILTYDKKKFWVCFTRHFLDTLHQIFPRIALKQCEGFFSFTVHRTRLMHSIAVVK